MKIYPIFRNSQKKPAMHSIKASRFIKNFLLSFEMKNLARKLTAAKNVSSDAIDGIRHISAILYFSIMKKLFFWSWIMPFNICKKSGLASFSFSQNKMEKNWFFKGSRGISPLNITVIIFDVLNVQEWIKVE